MPGMEKKLSRLFHKQGNVGANPTAGTLLFRLSEIICHLVIRKLRRATGSIINCQADLGFTRKMAGGGVKGGIGLSLSHYKKMHEIWITKELVFFVIISALIIFWRIIKFFK